MSEKIYAIVIKETGVLTSHYDVHDTFDKAKKRIYDSQKEYSDSRELRETELKNEFEVLDKQGNHIHTLQIIDLWVH